MSEQELKDNLCVVKFICIESNSEDCVHHKNKKQCKFLVPDRFVCTNSIAQVQAISRYLKHIGLELSSGGFNSGIYRSIKDEVNRAKTLHENKDYMPANWLSVLMSEVGEVADEIEYMQQTGEPMRGNYITELTQVAAVCVRMIDDFRKDV